MTASGINALGSRRDFDYFDDNGNKWAANLDESNTRLVNPSGDCGAATASQRIPSNIRVRRLDLIDATNTVPRSCVVLKVTPFNNSNGQSNYTLADTDSNAGTVVAPRRKIPEKVTRLVKSFDTGLTDGTQP
jgi:hypothetical protein